MFSYSRKPQAEKKKSRMLFSSRNVKFNLDFIIGELANIPEINGYCYIDIRVLNKRSRHNFGLERKNKLRNVNTKDGKLHEDDSSLSGSDAGESSRSSGGNISISTSKRKVHNFRCNFNYHVNCNVKFPFSSKENTISSKFLLMDIFFVPEEEFNKTEGKNENINRSNVLELGKLAIDLTEYLDAVEPQTNKYLMSESKVNSILSVALSLRELPEDYHFQTQLKVNDSPSETTSILNSANKRRTYNVAPSKQGKSSAIKLDRAKLINEFNSPRISSESDSINQSRQSLNWSDNSPISDREKLRNVSEPKSATRETPTQDRVDKDFKENEEIDLLYRKVLETFWDDELHPFFCLTPEERIKDIFDNDGKAFEKYENEILRTTNQEAFTDVNGLIDEPLYREDLKSWSVERY